MLLHLGLYYIYGGLLHLGLLPSSSHMPWENCRAVPSQQLPHVLCGAGAWYTALHSPRHQGDLKRGFSPLITLTAATLVDHSRGEIAVCVRKEILLSQYDSSIVFWRKKQMTFARADNRDTVPLKDSMSLNILSWFETLSKDTTGKISVFGYC